MGAESERGENRGSLGRRTNADDGESSSNSVFTHLQDYFFLHIHGTQDVKRGGDTI